MKIRSLILIGCVVVLSTILILLITFYNIQSFHAGARESTLELRFEKELITVFIRDKTLYSTGHTELTAISFHNLAGAHDKLPKTSSTDRIVAGSIISETAKSGTYLTKDGAKEFWYNIDGNDDEIITIELQDHEFDRIVFDSENNHNLIKQINEIVSDFKPIANVTTNDISVSTGFPKTQNTENPRRCSGGELCVSGKMDEVIDGDTIRIGGNDNFLLSTSFALSFAPELDEDGGEDAKKFIEILCPVGSEVLIDQDGWYPFDRYHGNMILSEVHCNGVNLNEALAESEHGYIGVGYCKNSEFGDRDWAINNGCPAYDEVRK
ncbi:hypothetical protein K0U27_06010 [archaeon]|nr:hypothetical protein [archaeon]